MNRISIPAKTVSGEVLVDFDFTGIAPVGSDILTRTLTAPVFSGVDAGSITINVYATGPLLIRTRISGGLVGVIYEVSCAIVTETPTTNLQLVGYLAVVPDL